MNTSDKEQLIDLLTQALVILKTPEPKYRSRFKALKLPEPPTGRVWYSAEDFVPGDLPKGYRPLLKGEVIPDKGTAHYFDLEHPREGWKLVTWPGNLPVDHKRGWPRAKLRTNAPLPKPKKGK